MVQLKALFSPARIATLIAILVAFAAFLTTVQSNLVPGSPAAEAIAKGVVMLGSVVGALGAILKVLDGQANWESIQTTGLPKNVTSVNIVNEAHDFPLAKTDAVEDVQFAATQTTQPDPERAAGFDAPGRESLGMDPDRPS